jgi:acyl-CoA reductase-like NAD-dependent aldehyde dehydrogenase
MKKILDLIDAGKRGGAKCVLGGGQHGNEGYFVEPTIFANVTDQMKIAQEEVLTYLQLWCQIRVLLCANAL